MLETPSISEYFDTMMYQSENLWSADNQQATHLSLVASCEEVTMSSSLLEQAKFVTDSISDMNHKFSAISRELYSGKVSELCQKLREAGYEVTAKQIEDQIYLLQAYVQSF